MGWGSGMTRSDRMNEPCAARPSRRAFFLTAGAAVAASQAITFAVSRPQRAADAPDIRDAIAPAREAVVEILAPPRPMLVTKTGGSRRLSGAAADGDLESRGAGFLIDPAGLVLTSHHVVAEAGRLSVRLQTGEELPARIVGSDRMTDLALLGVDAGRDLPALPLPPRVELMPGDQVAAVGAPYGYGGTVTVGVVSGLDRGYNDADPVGYIQHDAPINLGNSGGPLLDRSGQVAGINTAIADAAPFHVGIGFATPADLAAAVVAELRQRGVVARGHLGVRVQQVDRALADALGLAAAGGLAVTAVEDGSAAQTAGVQAGDVLAALGPHPMRRVRDLGRALLVLRQGASLSLSIRRGQAELEMAAVLGPSPAARPVPEKAGPQETSRGKAAPQAVDAGIVFADEAGASVLLPGLGREGAGIALGVVNPDSVFAAHGIAAGDVVHAIGAVAVASGGDARRLLREASGAPVAVLVSRRPDEVQYIVVSARSDAAAGVAMRGNVTRAVFGEF